MSRIAVDMDEVLADTLGKQLLWLEAQRGIVLRRERLAGLSLREVLDGDHFAALQRAMHEPDFFGDLAVMPGAVEVMRRLGERHELFVATAAMEYPASFGAKFDWLARHFPFVSPLHIVFCGDKSIVRADYLLDDSPRYFATFAGQPLLFAAPHNAHTDGVPIMKNWWDVAAYFAGEEPAH
jgi:5'(3')-deoxyribonucleotidase